MEYHKSAWVKMDLCLKILKYRYDDQTATNKNTTDMTSAIIPATVWLLLNRYETLIKPLKPRKSTIDITISTIITNGWI